MLGPLHVLQAAHGGQLHATGEVCSVAERWAKLYAKAGENPDIGELLETEPLTVSLWFLAISRADVYGILPADPRRFRVAVAPAAIIDCATVAQALHSMESRGWIRTYTTSGGELLLHITKYHKLQDVRWSNRIGPPEHELPEWWEPPNGFLEALRGIDLAKVRSRDNREAWRLLQERYCSATVALPLCYGIQTTDNRQQRTSTPVGSLEEVEVAEESPAEPTAPLGADPVADVVAYDNPEDLHLVKSNHTDLRNAITTALRNRPQERHADAWLRELLQYAEDYASEGITEQGIIDALTENPPKARDTGGTTWAKRVFPGPTPARASPKRLERTHAASPPEDFKTGRVKL